MTTREPMSTRAQTCQPHTNLAAMTQLEWNHECEFIPVVDAEGHVAGIITDRDIAPERIAASQAMGTKAQACLPTTDSVMAALEGMCAPRVRQAAVA